VPAWSWGKNRPNPLGQKTGPARAFVGGGKSGGGLGVEVRRTEKGAPRDARRDDPERGPGGVTQAPGSGDNGKSSP